MLAPVIIFAFNRPESFRRTVESLLANPEAADTDLFIFIDGPRNEDERPATDEVARVARTVEGFRSVKIAASSENKGLGPSVIAGVTEVIGRYGKVIVVEDDLILQPNFLSFINRGLLEYAHCEDVFSICGYTNKVALPADYPYDAYFGVRSSSWGWATWKDRWDAIDWQLDPWEDYAGYGRAFNRWGGSDCFGMLKAWKSGRNASWAIRFCFSQFLGKKVSLFPVRSHVRNTGFDGTGTNCKKWSRFKTELMSPDKVDFRLPPEVSCVRSICRSALRYHSVPRRILSRIMYILRK
ncbi:MAG: glycosyltransferase [Muribaculaceae bacterium]|nr:glycosyltransferase [Muribaculaceae bacterium]